MNPVQDSFSFLIHSLFQLYMLLVLLRFLFQLTRVDFRNPIVAPIVTLTHAPLAWLRRFIPGLYGIDLAAIVLFLLLGVIEQVVLGAIIGKMVSPLGALLWAAARLLDMSFWIFIIAIIIHAAMSWFVQQRANPLAILTGQLVWPLMRPVQNLLTPLGGIDFSPIVVLIALNFLQRLLISPLYHAAAQLM